MQLPTLRRPVAASALAGIVGAGLIDGLLSSRGGICLLSRRYLAERSERQHSKCNAHDAPKKENLS